MPRKKRKEALVYRPRKNKTTPSCKQLPPTSVNDHEATISTPCPDTNKTEKFVDCNEDTFMNDHDYLGVVEEEVTTTSFLANCDEDRDNFDSFKVTLKKELPSPFILHPNTGNEDTIQIVELYPSDERSTVKWMVMISKDSYKPKIFVHRIQVSDTHELWNGLPKQFNTISAICNLLSKLSSFSVCVGNFDEEFQDLVPIGSAIQHDADSIENAGYREGDFGAVCGNSSYKSTIRSTSCQLLVCGARCGCCSKFRSVLRCRMFRLKEKRRKSDCDENSVSGSTVNYISKGYRHCNMSKEDLIGKILQQKSVISDLEKEVGHLKRQFKREITHKGIEVNDIQNLELKDLMSSCHDEVEKCFPDENCYQRLFWKEQLKYANTKSSCGMRWHPMVIRWCLYLRHKSSATYEALRDSGFIKLPSSRTLFDYSHYIKSELGFQPDVIKVLKSEAEKKGMYSETYKCYVGVLFDEIKVKSDLVYDKHTGELIGFCNLDKVGNQISQLDKIHTHSEKSDLATFMLVLMVRGVASDLKFPLAGFATQSITADFLYPIVWKACRILETSAQLKVLFFTCDGASANRKFFNLHSQDDFTYYTVNPFDKSRKIYFISDVPHLLKTTRNCFANSYSHKNTRKLWKDGKDISWLHILRLYEEHCETSIYNPCPKLSRTHIDLTAFSFMKVNLAAQVLSSTVANSLEMMYGDNVVETVNFIRMMNKFFDCLNVRSLYEGRNKRNPNLEPYSNVADERLKWLTGDFLDYFSEWEESVQGRGGVFTNSQKKGMMLSTQTLHGLKMSVHSIVDCVKIVLNEGASFVLTNVFNQDPLEQHFGHYRHRVGDNCNPTVNDVRHIMTTMRTIGAQALAPSHGNCKRLNQNDIEIDESVLPRRKKLR